MTQNDAAAATARWEDAVGDTLELARQLIRFPSVTIGGVERTDEVARCVRWMASWLQRTGAVVRLFEGARYPALLAGFPGRLLAPVALSGHLDVVAPDPDETQFEPRVEGDYLWGRGAADMKVVAASFGVWLERTLRAGPPYPPVSLLLVGNEENGESEAWGTPQLLSQLRAESGWQPQLMVVGERTGERGDERFGEICTANRGILRLSLRLAGGARGHTGLGGGGGADLGARLVQLRAALLDLFADHLSLTAADGGSWRTAAHFPFMHLGEPGVFNISAAEGLLGVEVRPVPEDDLPALCESLQRLADEHGARLELLCQEAGISCPADNRYRAALETAVADVSGQPAVIGKKLAGTSARFAPGGNAVIWGQSGCGPHARDERHFIPSILPYLAVLDRFADSCRVLE